MKERHKLLAASYVIVINGDRVLLCRRYQTGYRDGQYGLPAGHVEAGETFVEAAIREAREEIGLELQSKDLVFVQAMHRRASIGDYAEIFFKTVAMPVDVQNREPEKCDELRWCPLDQLPENTIPYIADVLRSMGSVQYREVFDI